MARILLKRRTLSEWTAINEILGEGEVGVVIDSNPRKIKIGDGITRWKDIPLSFPNVIGQNGDIIIVDSYDEAEPYFTGQNQLRVYVLADDEYYDGDKSFYDYVPGFGVALMGVDFDYKKI